MRSRSPSADKELAAIARLGPWVAPTLLAIEVGPRVSSAILAVELDRDRKELKTDVRKLKRHGLTDSLEVGYRLTPRGHAYLRYLATS